MRRPFRALLLIALVASAFAVPSANAASLADADPQSEPGTGTVWGFVQGGIGIYRLQFQLWARDDTGTWVPTPYRSRSSATEDARVYEIEDVPPGTYRLLAEPLGRFDYRTVPAYRRTGEPYFSTSFRTGELLEFVVAPGTRTNVDHHPPRQRTTTVAPVREPSVQEVGFTRTFALTPGSWPTGSQVVSRQWFHASTEYSPFTPIDGATSTSLTPGPELAEQVLTVRTVVRTAGRPDTVHWTDPVEVTTPFTAAPTLTASDATVASPGRLTLHGGWDPGQPQMEVFVNGVSQGSYMRTFTVTPALAGRTVRVQVVATSSRQHRTVLTTTARVLFATRKIVQRPRVLQARVQQQPKLSTREDAWSPAPHTFFQPDARVTVRWFLDGRPLRSLPLVLPLSYAGHRLHATITATQPGYRTSSVTTPAAEVRAAFDMTSRPYIGDGYSSTVSVGQTVRVDAGVGWSPRPTRFRFQWYVGEREIAGATGSRLKVRSSYQGKRIRVKATGTRKGFGPVSRFSRTLRVTER